jgi:hypothetical protein
MLLPVLPPKVAGIERELGFKSHAPFYLLIFHNPYYQSSKLAREVKQSLRMPKISSKLLPVSDFI